MTYDEWLADVYNVPLNPRAWTPARKRDEALCRTRFTVPRPTWDELAQITGLSVCTLKHNTSANRPGQRIGLRGYWDEWSLASGCPDAPHRREYAQQIYMWSVLDVVCDQLEHAS